MRSFQTDNLVLSQALLNIVSNQLLINGSPITSQLNVGKSLYVDAINGVDSTGTRGVASLPFLTLNAAKIAASSGDIIYVGPGSYTPTSSLAKNGVNWSFSLGCAINATDFFIFDTTSGSFTFSVFGRADFFTNQVIGSAGTLAANNSGSNIHLEARSITNTTKSGNSDTGSSCIQCSNGTIRIYADLIQQIGDDYCVWWNQGNAYIHSQTITSNSTIYATVTSTYGGSFISGNFYVDADEIFATGNNGVCVLGGSSGGPQAMAFWIDSKLIQSTNGSAGTINIQSGKIYIRSEKVMGNTGCPFVINGQSDVLFYLTTQKIEADLPASAVTGSSFIKVGQWVSHASPSTAALTISGGTHNIQIQELNTTIHGVSVSGGTLQLLARIDLSPTPSMNPVLKSGGNLILDHCTLISNGSTKCISSSSLQSIISLGSWANNDIDSNTTILTAGGLTVDSNVQ